MSNIKLIKPLTKFKKVRLKCFNNKYKIYNIYLVIIVVTALTLSCVNANRPPRFLIEGQSEIVLRLKETPETPVGSLIYHLRGYDPDGDPLTFGVRPSHDSDIIKIENIEENAANIYLAKELDRETKDEYSIVLTLTDNHFGEDNYVTQSFLLLVEDINDNEPIFRSYQSVLEIPENNRPGIITALEATDQDEGAYGQVVYYLQELDGDNDIFSIATYQGKGILRLTGGLDYERKNVYQLRILAIDRANQGRVNTGTAAILVKVRDVEDQPPEFIQGQVVTRIAEDAPAGSEVLRVKAIDGDRGVNNKIKYSIERNDPFGIDEDTGIIYTTTQLDREDNEIFNGAYILKIFATEVSKINPPPYVKTEITIIVTDVNDETPTFQDEIYRCEITENSQMNAPLNFIDDVMNLVYDHDIGNNGTFRLYLEPRNDIFEIIPEMAVNEANFLIRVKNPSFLDYEQIKEMNFTIIAKEISPPGKWSTAELKIFIRDQNDNMPEFLQSPYEVFVLENSEIGTPIVQIQATDEDAGDFGTAGIRYIHLRGSIANYLHLDPITGLITISTDAEEAFDREVNTRHYLTVEARDNLGYGNQNTVQLIINIEDVNDNAPIFRQGRYEAKLLENNLYFETPLILEARDNDSNGTENSQVTYEIIDGDLKENFTIDPKKGILQPSGKIDFELLSTADSSNSNIKAFNLTIKARDSGMPNLWSNVDVTIYIQDVNDNPPIFEKSYYNTIIPEDLLSGSQILEIKAFDRDGSKPNNNIVYRIQNGASDKFIISADSGIIYVAQGASLDPDYTTPKKMYYILTVMALDGGLGNAQLTSTATVNITIKDVNNKFPILEDLPNLKIHENTKVGTIVYQILATDLDEKPILRYNIDKQHSVAKTEDGVFVKSSEYDFSSAFELNPVDGILKIVKILDREKVENIKLLIVVEDLAAAKGAQKVEAILNILIEDDNDNNPKFKMPFYKRSITENSKNGVTIGNVVAYDIDKNKTITYSLEGNPSMTGLIHLDPQTGEILVAKKIDHETYNWLNFTVRATDAGYPPRSSLVDVFVSILDENDNNPYFITTTKNFTISENSPIGSRIGIIQASDADSDDFGKITFLIDRLSSQGKFTIDADTGVLTVADKIDREIKDFYMLVIEAWDNYQYGYAAGESRNAFKQIYINILDENDSPPEINVPLDCVQITEYHDIKEAILTIRGNDADDPMLPNGRLEISIIKGNEDGLFQVIQSDPWTADIIARKSLKNKYGNHSLILSARDLGTPSNIVKKNLNICITDFNDHPPVFVSPSHNITVRIPENATVGSLIIQIHAIDDDVGINALVRYRLKPDPLGNYKTFEIDPDNGLLFLKEKLDRTKQKLYEIRIEAYDQGLPTSLSSDLDLAIYIRNVNDYEPQFLVENIFVNFTEHVQPGIEKIKLPDTVERDEVDDLDDPPSTVCYFIVHGNNDEIFSLDQENHILTVNQELDREIKPNHTIYVRATENCSKEPGIVHVDKFNMENLTFHETDYNQSNNDNMDIYPLRMTSNYRRSYNKKYETYFDRYKHSRQLRSLNNNKQISITTTDEPSELINVADENDNILMTDGTIVRIIINVFDINDNPPKFKFETFTGGFTTNSDFGLKFMELEASDPDEGINAVIKYYQIGETRQTLSEGLDNIKTSPFLIDENTGKISLNFDPQKGMKGYFDFMVLVNDTDGLKDTARVFIYLLREDQKVRFVFRLQPPVLRDKIHIFKNTLSNVTNTTVNIDEFKVHANKDGSVDKTKTDLYIHLVDNKTHSIYDVTTVLNLIDKHIERLDELFKEFNVLDTQPAEVQLLVGQLNNSTMFVWLIFLNIFLTIFLGLTLILCLSQRNMYKRRLRAAKVNIYSQPPSEVTIRDPMTRVPNTNKHSVQGSNPIWLKGYDNEWFENDEDLSPTRPDSLDENILTKDLQHQKLFDEPNDLNRHFNVYNQIDKIANSAQILAKRLETTEL